MAHTQGAAHALRRGEHASSARRSTPDEMDKLLEEQGKLQDAIEAAQRLGPRPHARDRHGRAAPAARRRRRHQALGRRAAPRGPVQDPAASARPAAARRAHQPPRRRERGLAGAATCTSTRARSWPSPTIATSSTTSPSGSSELDRGAGHPLEGQLLVLARAEAEAAGVGREGRVGAPAHARPASWSGCSASPRARQAKSKARLAAYEELLRRGAAEARGHHRDQHPARARASATWWSKAERPAQGATATSC